MNKRGGRREGAGRPKTLNGDLKRYSLYLDNETIKTLDACIAYNYGEGATKYKKAEYLRNLIMNDYRIKGKVNPQPSKKSIDEIIESGELFGNNLILIRTARILNNSLTHWNMKPSLKIDTILTDFYRMDEEEEGFDEIKCAAEYIETKYKIEISPRKLLESILIYYHKKRDIIKYPESQQEI